MAKDILNIQGAMFLFLMNQTFSNVFGTVTVSVRSSYFFYYRLILRTFSPNFTGHNKRTAYISQRTLQRDVPH